MIKIRDKEDFDKEELLDEFLRGAQDIANNIAREEIRWAKIRRKVLNLKEGEEPATRRYEFTLPKMVSAEFMLKIFEDIAKSRYSEGEYPYIVKSYHDDADFLYPGHYKGFIDKLYMYPDKPTLVVMFHRNPKDKDEVGSLDKKAQELFEEVKSRM